MLFRSARFEQRRIPCSQSHDQQQGWKTIDSGNKYLLFNLPHSESENINIHGGQLDDTMMMMENNRTKCLIEIITPRFYSNSTKLLEMLIRNFADSPENR